MVFYQFEFQHLATLTSNPLRPFIFIQFQKQLISRARYETNIQHSMQPVHTYCVEFPFGFYFIFSRAFFFLVSLFERRIFFVCMIRPLKGRAQVTSIFISCTSIKTVVLTPKEQFSSKEWDEHCECDNTQLNVELLQQKKKKKKSSLLFIFHKWILFIWVMNILRLF